MCTLMWILGISVILLAAIFLSVYLDRLESKIKQAVLSLLGNVGTISGRDLRQRLCDQGIDVSSPRFSMVMTKLEDEHAVRGWYKEESVGNAIIKARWYQLTEGGRKQRQQP